MALNVMGRNCDDHSKNFSFLLRKGGSWALSPAYDITFAHNPQGEWTNQHLMSVNGKFKDFQGGDFLEMADRFAVGSGKIVMAQVRDAIKQWPRFGEIAGLSQTQISAIGAQQILL